MAAKKNQDHISQNIYLTFCPDLFSERPDHVLVVPVFQGRLLFTRHKERGWELPGGKIEPGETPEEAAIRELWEETGANISKPKQVGEYRVEEADEKSFIKAIFLARVDSLGERPYGFETTDAALFPIKVDPNNPQFSPYMKDVVFVSIQQRLGTEIPLPT